MSRVDGSAPESTQERSGTPALLDVRGIEKSFPGARALRGIDLTVERGEVHALVGENGAGKSTLMHILAGVFRPDAGSITFDGAPDILIPDEQSARRLGIAIVYQERSLFDLLTVAENILVNTQPVTRWGTIDQQRMWSEAKALLEQVGLDVDPRTPLNRLSPAQQQMVEIAKALAVRAKLLIFDEPTAALSQAETDVLFRIIRKLKQEGAGVIYISHRLEEIFQIADRVTVLRDGEPRGTLRVAETSPAELIARMVGRELLPDGESHQGAESGAPPLLEVRRLCAAPAGGRPGRFQDVSFLVRPGEIVVLAGLTGAGRTELALALFGLTPVSSGEILLDGKPVTVRSPRDAIAAGIGYVPEDRKEAGLFLDMGVAENVAAARLEEFGSWWTDDRRRDATACEFVQRLRIAVSDIARPVRDLSGGNQQKIALSKWFLRDPKVLIVDEPTRGVDVGAKREVHNVLRKLAGEGKAIVVISSDLPEVLSIADRILVIRMGRIAAELPKRDASEENLMRFASTAATSEVAIS